MRVRYRGISWFPPVALAAGLAACTSLFGAPPVKVRAVEHMPESFGPQHDAAYESAKTAIDARDYARALDYLQVARARDPNNAKVLNALGVVYDKLGRFDLSARYYAQARAADPGSAIVARNLAYSNVLQGLIDPAFPKAVAAATPARPTAVPSPLVAAVPAVPVVAMEAPARSVSVSVTPVKTALVQPAMPAPVEPKLVIENKPLVAAAPVLASPVAATEVSAKPISPPAAPIKTALVQPATPAPIEPKPVIEKKPLVAAAPLPAVPVVAMDASVKPPSQRATPIKTALVQPTPPAPVARTLPAGSGLHKARPVSSPNNAAVARITVRAIESSAPPVAVSRIADATGKQRIVTIGHPILMSDASGRAGLVAIIGRRLAQLGWTLSPSKLARVQQATVLYYPPQNAVAAQALQHTLPFQVRLIADPRHGMQLVMGRDYLSWKPKNPRLAALWGQQAVVAALSRTSRKGVR